MQSRADYSAFMVKHLLDHMVTPWVLVVQWGGYVVDTAVWSETFFDYDYIGASWPFHRDGMNVGNGGFSLRSTKLLRALDDERIELLDGMNEDDLICRMYRPRPSSEFGIRFVRPEIADRFAYERARPDGPTFGFDAAFNLWRHVDDDTMMDIVRALDVRSFTSSEVMQLLMAYYDLSQFACVKVMYERYRRIWYAQQILHNMIATGVRSHAVVQYIDDCERAVKRKDSELF
nr:DUF5672 family protein [Burkholderia sp. Ac-20345]